MIDEPTQNKMMTGPPMKKGFHFASDGIHFAEFIEAETIQEAQIIYHRVKRVLYPTGQPLPQEPAQSTPAVDEEIKQ
jgi:hypothetical protein